MKLNITTNQGTLLGTIDSMEMYDLDKAMGQAGFMEEVKGIVRSGAKIAEGEGEYIPTFNERPGAIKEQSKEAQELISDAAKAQELFTDDELETGTQQMLRETKRG